ncbi:MAG: TVP38/TMEM64 family protein [Dehalococcoidia bacterium]
MEHHTSSDIEDLFFEGDETPLLLRKSVLVAIVAGFLALLGIYVAITVIFDISLKIDAKPFKDWVEARGAFGVAVFILAMAASVLFAPIPNAPIFIAAGLAWGPILGTVYCMAGLTIGSAAAFWVSRRFGRQHLPRLIGRRAAAHLDSLADNMGAGVVFWTRIMPGLNFDWISFVAGMTSVPFRTFIVFSFLGMIPPTAITVAMGDQLGRNPLISIALGGIWVLAIVGTAFYFWRRRRTASRAKAAAADSRANPEAELG